MKAVACDCDRAADEILFQKKRNAGRRNLVQWRAYTSTQGTKTLSNAIHFFLCNGNRCTTIAIEPVPKRETHVELVGANAETDECTNDDENK